LQDFSKPIQTNIRENLQKEIQEKATLSKNFQTFLKFMKKENNDE
jgi:hypothetical protein